MAGLIKKQILKHLSKFAKNLSADSINISTLRGEGELNNLELDCVALQNLMNLPTWLQFNHAKCNRVHVKIPFTKLKTAPITILLDSVELDMSTCEKPRAPNGASPIQASASSGDSSYGFVQKVLEGIAVRINSISVNFTSAVFKAEFQISQLLLFSTDPEGKQTDLRFTRILNKEWGQVLTFKKVTWQTMRIVTDAATSQSGATATPIRLITNQAQIGITLRRKISDLSVLATKLHVQFDDLLWVLTDAQVQSALLCVKSIRETIERSQQQQKQEQKQPEEVQANSSTRPTTTATTTADPATSQQSTDAYFNRYNIQESSVHLDLDRIDLHICDDGTTNNNQATYKKVVEGGAILMTFFGLKIDHYPSHKGAEIRTHFRDYGEIPTARDKWAHDIISNFRKDFVTLKKAAMAAMAAGNTEVQVSKSKSKLLESCLIIRLNDIEISQVTSSSDKERCNDKILSSQRKELLLPDDMPLGYVSITDYFYPDGRDYPAPHSNIFVRVNAPRVRVHWPSFLWCNQLALSTVRSVQKMLEDLGIPISSSDPKEEDHVDIRVETLMPRIFIPSFKTTEDTNSPIGLEIQVSQSTITNCRYGENCSRSSLSKVLQSIKDSYIFNNSGSFPCEPGYDLDHTHHALHSHANHQDTPLNTALHSNTPQLKSSSLKQKAYTDVWNIWLRQVWVDFVIQTDQSNPTKRRSTLPFVDSLPITMWISKSEKKFSDTSSMLSSNSESELRQSQSTPMFEQPHTNSSGFDRPASYPTSPLRGTDIKTEDLNDKSRPARNKKLLDFYRSSLAETPAKVKKEVIKPLKGTAGTYILIHSEKPVRLMLDHFQFLFLLRLFESFEGIEKKVSSDTASILSDTSSSCNTLDGISSNSQEDDNTSDTTAVRLVFPSADINLVLRAKTEEEDDEDKTSNLDDDEQSTSDTQDLVSPISPPPLIPNPSSSGSPTPAPSECSSDTISILGSDEAFGPSIRTSTTCPVDVSNTPLGGSSEQPVVPLPQGRRRANTDLSVAVRLKSESRLKSRLNVVSSPSSISSTASCDNLSNRSTIVSSSGYETGSVDSVNQPVLTGFDDDIKSLDSSCDGDAQFVIIEVDGQPRAVMDERTPLLDIENTGIVKIPPPPPVMVQSQDTILDTESDVSQDTVPCVNDKSTMDLDMVSVFKISATDGVELCVDAGGENTVLRIAAHTLGLHELGNMTRDNSAVQFSSPDTTTKKNISPPILPSLRMRLDGGPAASRFSPASASNGIIRINAQDVEETVCSSTLENIGAFLEDEVAPDILPMKVEATNIHLTIKNDIPPIYPTSAAVPPVELHVHSANITRDDEGVFHISTESSAASSSTLLSSLSGMAKQNHKETTSTQTTSQETKTPVTTPTETSNTNHTHTTTLCNGVLPNTLHTTSPLTLKQISKDKVDSINDNQVLVNGDISNDYESLKERINELTRERDSLAAALSHIQEELMLSERDRATLKTQVSQSS
nr:UHRF1-binding protein 1-like [Ciona intestinalis]|eukprot:XP_002121271.2 UHRF1-binding protein 1-like [Ciona intestinalis]